MENKLSNIKVEDYSVEFTPATIKINGIDKLGSLIASNISKYQSLVVTPENVKDAKKIKANLNKLRKALDEKRLEIKKANAKPYLEVENQIKNIEKSIGDVVNPINNAVKELDDQEKEARHEWINKLIQEMASTRDIEPSEVEFNPLWLRKSMSKHAIEKDLDDVMKQIITAHKAIEVNVELVKQLCEAKNIEPDAFVVQAKNGQPADELMESIQQAEKARELRLDAKKAHDRVIASKQVKVADKVINKEGSKQISKRVIKMNRYKFEGLAEPTLPVSNTNTPVSNTGIPHFENDKDSITLLDKHTRTTSSKKDHRHKHKKHVYDKDSDYYKLSEFFVKQILNNNPNFKKPNIQKWSDDFRIMIERDHRDKHQVAKLILWVQHDSFWMANVLSPTKLREKYDSLVMRMNNSSEPHVSNQSKIEKPENKIDSKKKDELLKQARERDQKFIEEE